MRKGIISLLAVLLLLTLLGSSVVYASGDIPEGTGETENVQKPEGAESDEESQKDQNVILPGNKGEEDGQKETQNDNAGNDTSAAYDAKTNVDSAVQDNVKRPYGWYRDPASSSWYFYDNQGNKYSGWLKWGNKWYYFDKNHAQFPCVMVTDCKQQIGGGIYFFDAGGVMQTGWVRRPEGWYYANGGGAMLSGWHKINGKWYYMDWSDAQNPGLMAANGEYKIGSQIYFFDGSGAMQAGWVRRPEGWYYTDANGCKVSGWHKVGNKWYYMDYANAQYPGLMTANGEYKIGSQTYLFDGSGAMRTGWIKKSGGWHYYDEYSGQIVSGWKSIGGKWYYMNPANNNIMVSGGWAKIGNLWYCFNSNGTMATGWLKSGGRWYYLGSDGGARTGWKVVGSDWYYFYKANDSHGGPEGAMASNVKIDGWQLTSSGAMVSTAEMKMNAKAQIYSSSTKYLILVDRSACKVAVYTGWSGSWTRTQYWSCSPGKPSTPTVAGTFKVGIKGRYFDSGSSRCHWYTQFKGNYLFHSVLYSKSGKINDGRLGMQLSHGCVRLDINNAKWIYDNIPKGTTVVVY